MQTTVDSEIVLHLIAQPSENGHGDSLIRAVRRIEGAYTLVIMTEQELIGVRDPHGFRPLSIGRVDDAWVLASESCAFDLIHVGHVRYLRAARALVHRWVPKLRRFVGRGQ